MVGGDIVRWIDLLVGTETVVFSARERRIVTAVMIRAGISALSVKNTDDGGLSAELRRRDYRRLCTVLSERGVPIPGSSVTNGMPRLLQHLKKRPGLPVGAFLALAMWIASTLFVWRVDVICLDNSQGTRAEDHVDVASVQYELAEAGIFWELNVNCDSIHGYSEHEYVKRFMASEREQVLVRAAGLEISVGFDGHRVYDYLPARVADYCHRVTEMGIRLVYED